MPPVGTKEIVKLLTDKARGERGSFKEFPFGMLPLILTVLKRDSNRGY